MAYYFSLMTSKKQLLELFVITFVSSIVASIASIFYPKNQIIAQSLGAAIGACIGFVLFTILSKLSFKTGRGKEARDFHASNTVFWTLGIAVGVFFGSFAFVDARQLFGAIDDNKQTNSVIAYVFEILMGFGSGFAIVLFIFKVTPKSYFYLTVAAIFFLLSTKYYVHISEKGSNLSLAGVVFMCLILSKFVEALLGFIVIALPKRETGILKKLADWLDIE